MTKKRLTQKMPVDRFYCKALTFLSDVGKHCYVVTTHMYTSIGMSNPRLARLCYAPSDHTCKVCVCVCVYICIYIYIYIYIYIIKIRQFLCCSMYCLFCVVLCIVCVYMCTVLLPPGGYPIAVNKYITS